MKSRSSGCQAMVVLCLDDDYSNLHHGMQLSRKLMRWGDDTTRLFVRLTESSGWARMIDQSQSDAAWAKQLIGFGTLEDNCAHEVFTAVEIDGLAKAVHTEYAERHEEDAVPWDDLPWVLQASNRQAALHIAVKLAALGYVPAEAAAGQDPEMLWQPTGEQVEMLSELEHRRWVAERSLNGWVMSEVKDVSRRETPYLCGWEALDDSIKEEDRAQVRAYGRILKAAGTHLTRKA